VQVYEKVPTGLRLEELRAHAKRHPQAAAFAAVRGVAGLVAIACITLPFGIIWFVAGVALLASVFMFARAAGEGAVIRPALMITGRPKWDGVRRTSWRIEADDVVAQALALADGLDAELGESLTAIDEGTGYRGTTRREAFDSPPGPVVIAWGIDQRARLAADGDRQGVWLRLEVLEVDQPPVITILANTGRALEVLKHVAWRV